MNAAVLYGAGEPPRYESFPEPTPEADEKIVRVLATALKPVDRQMASGSHYAAYRAFPAVPGVDGVGVLGDGSRVFFARPRKPYGGMAELTVTSREMCWPLPDELDAVTAAAILNPGMSAFLSLTWRGKLAPGDTVLILGATGTTGRLAIQLARHLGAGRIVAAGRNEEALATLPELGADATIPLGLSDTELSDAFAREAGATGYQVIIDYLWGRPTERLLAAIGSDDFTPSPSETRLVQVGESAGATIALPAATLRSTALTIRGNPGGMPPREVAAEGFGKILELAAGGALVIDTEPMPLADVEAAWRSQSRSRIVLIP